MIEGIGVLVVIGVLCILLLLPIVCSLKLLSTICSKIKGSYSFIQAIIFAFLYALTIGDVVTVPKTYKFPTQEEYQSMDFLSILYDFLGALQLNLSWWIFYGCICVIAVISLPLFVNQLIEKEKARTAENYTRNE